MDKGFIVSLIFALVVGVFALANSEAVVVDFIFTKVHMSQALIILFSALLGAIIVFFIGLIRTVKLKQRIKRLERENEALLDRNDSLSDLADELIVEELNDMDYEMDEPDELYLDSEVHSDLENEDMENNE